MRRSGARPGLSRRSGFRPDSVAAHKTVRESGWKPNLRIDGDAVRRWWQLVPWEPPAETPAERRRWLGLMLAGWLTMFGAIVAALGLRLHPVLLLELIALIVIAFPVVWRLHFSTCPRFWSNQIPFVVALVLGIMQWRQGLFSGGEAVSRLVVGYRVLVSAFYWVMAFRAFAIRTVRDLVQTALPAYSGLLLALIATRAPSALLGAAMVMAGTLLLLAGEHATERARQIDARIPASLVRGGHWRPTVNSWLSLLLAAAAAAAIIAAVATRFEPTNAVGQYLRRELAWRLARIMMREGEFPYAATRTLALGGPAPRPQDRLMLIVKAENPVRPRTAVYDLYDGKSWGMSRPRWMRVRSAEGRFRFPEPERLGLARAVTEELEVEITGGSAFVGLLPVPWCAQEVRIDTPSLRYDESGMVSFSGYLLPGDTIRARIAWPNAMTAPPDIPPIDRVDLENALQLPDELPRRVRELARRVVADAEADSPLRAAIAIENYLRDEDNFVYDLNAPEAPEAQDYVDHFLFTSRVGFCNHFATAMAVMLRAQGIPCRLATGFTAGENQMARGVYEIRDQDAHAWVEVYLPRIGWIDLIRRPILRSRPPVAGTTRGARRAEGGAGRRRGLGAGARGAGDHADAAGGGRAHGRSGGRPLLCAAPAAAAPRRVSGRAGSARLAAGVLARAGLPRPPGAAPWEFQRAVAAGDPGPGTDLGVLTGKYVAARFGATMRRRPRRRRPRRRSCGYETIRRLDNEAREERGWDIVGRASGPTRSPIETGPRVGLEARPPRGRVCAHCAVARGGAAHMRMASRRSSHTARPSTTPRRLTAFMCPPRLRPRPRAIRRCCTATATAGR